ncbi:MAG TPA: nucleoside triphosphate pyrophosphohydrolase family protein [Pirellulaceae bacterium]|nr:nucleoside triphosphate pyrophosphohydrolase family protein [Pirellulaceae bacterium]
MQDAIDNVRDFHRHIGAPIAQSPTLLPCRRDDAATIAVQLRDLATTCHQMAQTAGDLPSRLSLALEEMAEWTEAHAAGDLVAAADAWGDRMYVLLGDAVATGLPGGAILDEVHRSNMSKELGSATVAGKGVKTDRFVPPDLAKLLDKSRE